ncbi:hypothetical protein EDD29_5384 [Actinocorallia herbida]|uniref:Polyketide cyclase/dehydrase/lipid transport protein n=1 Tax=Actinocorallia herbida TaxID=58109 RepID=A0A3N1D3V4_9ACTN|nr:hypothetical protein [Actinocorallia herbida]ROO87748.1 hypothetical protein EDD29_5384 [Actinocorallia herbida]
MTTIRFHLMSELKPDEVMAVLTDFGPARAEAWPTIDADHFKVHEQGDTWAVVTEGTESAWERARYEWDPDAHEVVIGTEESKLFGAGGGWRFSMTPEGDLTRVDIELTRNPTALRGRLLALLLPLAGPPSLRKSFKGPLRGV